MKDLNNKKRYNSPMNKKSIVDALTVLILLALFISIYKANQTLSVIFFALILVIMFARGFVYDLLGRL